MIEIREEISRKEIRLASISILFSIATLMLLVGGVLMMRAMLFIAVGTTLANGIVSYICHQRYESKQYGSGLSALLALGWFFMSAIIFTIATGIIST